MKAKQSKHFFINLHTCIFFILLNFGANNEIKPETRDFSLEDQNFTTKSCSQRKFLPLFIIIINDNDNSNMHIEDNDGALVY